jgi:hypothetical protein
MNGMFARDRVFAAVVTRRLSNDDSLRFTGQYPIVYLPCQRQNITPTSTSVPRTPFTELIPVPGHLQLPSSTTHLQDNSRTRLPQTPYPQLPQRYTRVLPIMAQRHQRCHHASSSGLISLDFGFTSVFLRLPAPPASLLTTSQYPGRQLLL